MSIQDAVQVLSALGLLATAFLTIFVSAKIGASERRMLKEMSETYLPRELADEKFRYYDYLIGDSNGAGTPRHPRRQTANEE